MNIERLDHLVLTVQHIEETIAFYTNILGMKLITFGQNRKALTFGNQKINLHEKGKEFEPKAHLPTCGSADLCFIVSTEIEQVKRTIEAKGVTVIEGIVERTGAIGKLKSIYLRDPDQNLIELSNYIESH